MRYPYGNTRRTSDAADASDTRLAELEAAGQRQPNYGDVNTSNLFYLLDSQKQCLDLAQRQQQTAALALRIEQIMLIATELHRRLSPK